MSAGLASIPSNRRFEFGRRDECVVCSEPTKKGVVNAQKIEQDHLAQTVRSLRRLRLRRWHWRAALAWSAARHHCFFTFRYSSRKRGEPRRFCVWRERNIVCPDAASLGETGAKSPSMPEPTRDARRIITLAAPESTDASGRRLQARAAHGTRGEPAQIKIPVQRISPESGLITWIRANESTNSFRWRRRPSRLAWTRRIQVPIGIGRRTCRGGPTSGRIPAEDFFASHTHIEVPHHPRCSNRALVSPSDTSTTVVKPEASPPP